MKTQKHRKTSDWAKTITLACACMCVSWVWEVSQSNAYSYQARTEIFYSIPLNLKSANLDLLNWFHNLPMSQKLHRKSTTESPQKARRVTGETSEWKKDKGMVASRGLFWEMMALLLGALGFWDWEGTSLLPDGDSQEHVLRPWEGTGWGSGCHSCYLSLPRWIRERLPSLELLPGARDEGPIVEGLRQLGFISSRWCSVNSTLGFAFRFSFWNTKEEVKKN